MEFSMCILFCSVQTWLTRSKPGFIIRKAEGNYIIKKKQSYMGPLEFEWLSWIRDELLDNCVTFENWEGRVWFWGVLTSNACLDGEPHFKKCNCIFSSLRKSQIVKKKNAIFLKLHKNPFRANKITPNVVPTMRTQLSEQRISYNWVPSMHCMNTLCSYCYRIIVLLFADFI